MKNRVRAGGRNLFLLELMFSILFFSLTAAVCLQLFAQSHKKSNDAAQLSRAVSAAANCAEIFSAAEDSDAFLPLLEDFYPAVKAEGKNLEIPMEDLTLHISLSRQDGMDFAEILAADGEGNPVYTLKLSHHVQRGNPNG